MSSQPERTLLAVHATARGIGFVLFESPLSIIDWGVKHVSGPTKNAVCTNAVRALINMYAPDALVIESTQEPKSRRTKRVRALYRMLEGAALTSAMDVERIRRVHLMKCFERLGARTKQERADVIANHLPALAHKVPAARKAWQSEDPKMALFDAAALGFAAYYEPVEGGRSGS